MKYDDLFLPRTELSKFPRDPWSLSYSSVTWKHMSSPDCKTRAHFFVYLFSIVQMRSKKIYNVFLRQVKIVIDWLRIAFLRNMARRESCQMSANKDKKFSSILSGDARELKSFAELFEKCSVIVKDIRCYINLDSLDRLTLLVKNLPYNLRTRWVKRAVQVENRSGKLANFSHFSEFVQHESDEAKRSLNVKRSDKSLNAKSLYSLKSLNVKRRKGL